MRPFIVTPPVGNLVETADLLPHLVGNAEDAALITGYQLAAMAYLDGYGGRLGRCLLPQKWAFPLFDAPDTIYLPFPDCRDFKFEYLGATGVWTEVIGPTLKICGRTAYAISDLPADTEALMLTCVAGWESAAKVPASIKHAVYMLVGHWYENRAAVDNADAGLQVPLGFEALISPYKNVIG